VKKLIFLLIMALAFVGMVPAIGAANPPGVFTLDTVLSENSAHESVVTSDTVLDTQGFSALFGGAAFLWPDRTAALVHVLTAIVALVGAYIGLQVVNNGVKGKFFNPELYHSENGEEEK